MGTAFGLDAAFESAPELGRSLDGALRPGSDGAVACASPHPHPHPAAGQAIRQRWWPRWRAQR
jgi:hypothetical protein